MTFKIEADNGKSRTVDTRSQAEEIAEDMEALGMSVEITEIGTDGGSVDVVDHTDEKRMQEPKAEGIDALAEKDISEDPLSVMPGHFVDTIQGVPTINRKGYAVLAEHFGVSVVAEPVTLPGDTDFEYAEFKAIATTKDGTEYSGFGSAHVDRMDGDDPYLLAELAETRAMKRATAWATGVGMTAYEEMSGSL